MKNQIILYDKKRAGKRKKAETLFFGAFSLAASTILVKIIGAVYKIPLSHILGDSGMGYFNSAYTVFGCVYLVCTAGVPKAVSLLISSANAGDRRYDEETVYRVALRAFFWIGFLLSAGLWLFAPFLSKEIGNTNACPTIRAVAPSVFFVSVGGVMRGYLNGRERLSPIAVSQLLESVCKLLLGLLFAGLSGLRGNTLAEVSAAGAWGITVGSFLSCLYLYICVKNEKLNHNERQKIEGGKRKNTLQSIFRVAIPVTLSAGVMSLCNVVDLAFSMRRLLELGYTETEASALYGNYTTLCVSMWSGAVSLAASVSLAYFPRLCRAYAGGVGEDFRNLFFSGIRFSVFLTVPFTVAFVVIPKPILSLLFRETSAQTAAPLLSVLAPAVLLCALLYAVNTALEATGFVAAPLITMGIGSVGKWICTYCLVGNAKYGMMGAPIGTVVFYALALLTAMILFYRKTRVRISLLSLLWRPAFCSFGALVGVGWIFLRLGETQGSTLLAGVVFVLLYLLLALFMGELHALFQKNATLFTKKDTAFCLF